MLNINTIIYIYNNCGFFSTFIFFIKKIIGVIATFYKKNNIFITWRIPIGINCIIDIVDVLYIFNLFINLFLVLKFRINKLYITIFNREKFLLI